MGTCPGNHWRLPGQFLDSQAITPGIPESSGTTSGCGSTLAALCGTGPGAIERGTCRVDLMRGDEPYKYEWGAVDEPIYRLLLERQPT